MTIDRDTLRDATRLALQSAVAVALLYLTMVWLDMPERFVGCLSAVLVVQPSVGSTAGQALDRVIASLVGCAIGVVCLYALPDGWGTAAALAVSMLLMNPIAGFRSEWRYGVVAAVALSLGTDGAGEAGVLQSALNRMLAIGLGAAIGTAVSLLLWYDSATKRARRHADRALSAVAERLDNAIDGADDDSAVAAEREYHRTISLAQQAAAAARRSEREALGQRVERIDRLYNSVVIVKRAAGEADGRVGENEALIERCRDIADRLADCLRQAVDGRSADADALHAIGKRLAESHELLPRATATAGEPADPSSPAAERRKAALVFGLGELLDDLAEERRQRERD